MYTLDGQPTLSLTEFEDLEEDLTRARMTGANPPGRSRFSYSLPADRRVPMGINQTKVDGAGPTTEFLQSLMTTVKDEVKAQFSALGESLKATMHIPEKTAGSVSHDAKSQYGQPLIDFGQMTLKEATSTSTLVKEPQGRRRTKTQSLQIKQQDRDGESVMVVKKTDPHLPKWNGEDTVKSPYLNWRMLAIRARKQRPEWTDEMVG